MSPGLNGYSWLTRDEVDNLCKKLGNVQKLTDKAVAEVRKNGDYMGPADFGTKVHKMIADKINGKGEPDYKAEVSGFKSSWAKAKYGQKETRYALMHMKTSLKSQPRASTIRKPASGA